MTTWPWIRRRLEWVRGRIPDRRGPVAEDENPLEKYFRSNNGRVIHKWIHYFDVYHRHFARFRGKPVVILEFGVNKGGSLQMWRDYFGDKATIYGVDIDPRCAELGGRRIKIFIGDQEDRDFLRRIAAEIGPIDVLIEDGGHTMGQQIATFEELYPHVTPDGVFLTEDVHTSYWTKYGGGYRKPSTFMEYAKGLTDQLNAWHSHEEGFGVDGFTRTTRSMHFYDSIVVFEKGTVVKPHAEKTGRRSAPRPSSSCPPAADAPGTREVSRGRGVHGVTHGRGTRPQGGVMAAGPVVLLTIEREPWENL